MKRSAAVWGAILLFVALTLIDLRSLISEFITFNNADSANGVLFLSIMLLLLQIIVQSVFLLKLYKKDKSVFTWLDMAFGVSMIDVLYDIIVDWSIRELFTTANILTLIVGAGVAITIWVLLIDKIKASQLFADLR